MESESPQTTAGLARYAALPYIVPFVAFLAFLTLDRYLPFPAAWVQAIRFVAVFALLAVLSRRTIAWRFSNFPASALLGMVVFIIWVGPDILWPAYRESPLFHNSIVGAARSSLPAAVKTSFTFVTFRVLSSVVNVPVLEELFWRGWLMRWLIAKDFRKAPLGAYTWQSFWLVAVLFASEHGAYWDVGLAAGVLYNWWMLRTRSLADCILAHAVTNACLAVYVLRWDQWQYWL